MTERMDASLEPAASLPCPLPRPYRDEPTELRAYREAPGDEKTFVRLRRTFRDAEQWRALADLMVIHAAWMQHDGQSPNKAAELCMQAYEVRSERLKDPTAATHALARVVLLKPDHARAIARLRDLYQSMGAHHKLIELLRFRLRSITEPTRAAELHVELATVLRERFDAIGEAVSHYEQALAMVPGYEAALAPLVELYLDAGASPQATIVIEAELQRTAHEPPNARTAELYRTLARIEASPPANVPAAARYLQASLAAVPEDVEALREFGELYLRSGTSSEGARKAANIFNKAAEVARRGQQHDLAIKLLRRALGVAPEHQESATALERTLIEANDWLALDDLYRQWLQYGEGADTVPLLLRRADLLETHLLRREEARQLFEEASRYEAPDGDSWRRLEHIYAETSDVHALVSLLEAREERAPESMPTDDLLRTATLYRNELGNDERAAVFYYKVLAREPFNHEAFEGYKEHWRRKQHWGHLRELILFQIEQATAVEGEASPAHDPAFADEFVELAEISERRLGDIEGALDAWHKMAALYPHDLRSAKAIARIEKRTRMWDNMVRVQESELARTTDPRKRLDILKRLTQVYRDRQVDPSRAIELYQEILELSVGDVQATRALTDLYDRAGDYPQVVQLLRQQFERSRSPTEQNTLLRRLAELWHHELQSPQEALWACTTILERSPADRDAFTRLQQILEEQGRYPELLKALKRERDHAGTRDHKVKALRRMAWIAEHHLNDEVQTTSIWVELVRTQPGNIDNIDKLIALYESTGRTEELGRLLRETAASDRTEEVRQVDYLLRLAQLAESSLDDPQLARTSYETVLQRRANHQGALEALVRLYRTESSWQPLVDALGRLQLLAETHDEAFRIAWDRYTILIESVGDPHQAIVILEELAAHDYARGNPSIARALLDLYERAEQHQSRIQQAELLLLASSDAPARSQLYDIIANTWLVRLDNPEAALATYARRVREFPDDIQVLQTVAELQVDIGDFESALATLEQRLETLSDPTHKVQSLVQMSTIAQEKLDDGPRAMDSLRRAINIDPHAKALMEQARQVASKHNQWPEFLHLLEECFDHPSHASDVKARLALCFEASMVAERRCDAAPTAFEWARRGFALEVEYRRDVGHAEARLRELATRHHLWAALLEIFEEEINAHLGREEIDQGEFDLTVRLQQMADIALESLDDASLAVAYLQRAYELQPSDPQISERLETTARSHQQWPALIALYQSRRAQAGPDAACFEACIAIADIYEQELKEPSRAFEWIRQAWLDLHHHEAGLADEAIELLLSLSERHSLWPQLAEHYIERALEAFRAQSVDLGLAQLCEAATVFDERLDDPLSALRILAQGLAYDPRGEQVLPRVQILSDKIDDRRDDQTPAIGALLQLAVLQRLIGRSQDKAQIIQWLERRAEIREFHLRDLDGAMAEWLRVLYLRHDDDQALVELERIAEDAQAWNLFLILPAWQLAQATGDPSAEASHLRRLAQLYEGPLERPEYALRARLQAWRRHPTLPTAGQELDDTHATIWRLAEQTGAYRTPPVPIDPLLHPTIELPELADLRVWATTDLDPDELLETRPSALSPSTSDLAPIPRGAPASPEADASPSGVPDTVPISDTMEIEEIEEVELIELEVSEEDDTVTRATAIPATTTALREEDDIGSSVPPPPPNAGLPAIPKLTGNILPGRPRVASAWEEVDAAYASAPAHDQNEHVEVALVRARVWEEGANRLEQAFQAHEQALRIAPEHPGALLSLQELADRHDAIDRLIAAYRQLLTETSEPDHSIAHNMRIAALEEKRDDLDVAHRCYREVLRVQPQHVEALNRLLQIYSTTSRIEEYVETLAKLIDIQRSQWPPAQLVERSLELVHILIEQLDRTDDAVEHLRQLVRQCPQHQAVHEALIEGLIALQRWQPAIEAMRNAWLVLDDPQFHYSQVVRAAQIYEEELGLPKRALVTLQDLVDAPAQEVPDALLDHALMVQQRLCEATGRYEQLVVTIERRLERVGDDHEQRVRLLVDRARALQEGLGNQGAAIAALEELLEQAPDRDDVAIELSQLHRASGHHEAGISLLKKRWESRPGGDERAVPLALTLATAIAEQPDGTQEALSVLEATAEHHPHDPQLHQLRVDMARSLDEPALLVAALQARGEDEDRLEAARLEHHKLNRSTHALRLYSQVLANAKRHPGDQAHARRLAAALEGLVKLRVDDGDTEGAMDFMDRQLAEIEGDSVRALLLTEMGRITHQNTGDIEAARARFDAALTHVPDHPGARLGLARILIQTEDFSDAERLLLPAIEALEASQRHIDLTEALILLAEVFEQTGRSAEAYRRLTAALRHEPDNLEIRVAIVRNRYRARRYRDVLAAIEHIEQRLAQQPPAPHEHQPLSDAFVLAGLSEQELKQPDEARRQLEQALQLAPQNPAALEPLIPLCQERGEWDLAAGYAFTLAQQTDLETKRAQRFVDAALLYFDTAAISEDPLEPSVLPPAASLRATAQEALVEGLALLDGYEEPMISLSICEAIFDHISSAEPIIALRVLERLFRHQQIPPERHHDLLLEGTRLALVAGERLELAERYAFKARQLIPHSSAAVMAHAEVFEATDRIEEIEPLVESFFKARGDEGNSDQERTHRMNLLLHLAKLQRSQPDKALVSLERAAQLAPQALSASQRRRLAELYSELDRRDEAALDNHQRLLEQDPLFVPSLYALAKHQTECGVFDAAFALYSVLALVEPEHPEAQRFLADYCIEGEPIDHPVSERWINSVRPPSPPDAGVCDSLLLLWEHGGPLLGDYMPKLEVPPEVRISPLSDDPIPRAWAELLKRLGPTKVALVDPQSLPDRPALERPEGIPNDGYFLVRCQTPPVIFIDHDGAETQDFAELVFALGRAMYFARPDAVMAMGLRRIVLAQLLSAMFQAFHPRHIRRRHHSRGTDDDIGRLGQELVRKLPVKVSRRMGNLFRNHQDQSFNSRHWRTWIHHCGNRVGLALTGDLRAALRVMNPQREQPTGDALVELAQSESDIKDLLVFATSPQYVAAQRALGYTVRPVA